MTGLLSRLAPAGWMRAPRPTARLRLALLYGVLFSLSGATLLAITYLLFERATDPVTLRNGGEIMFGDVAYPAPTPGRAPQQVIAGTVSHGSGGPAPRSMQPQAERLLKQAVKLHAFDMHELLIWSALALGLMVVASVVLGWVVAGRVLRPVRTIGETARRIGASNLHERLNLDGPDDEFRELATTLDDLLERLEGSFDSQRRFVANASHELRTPLTLDRALLERALRNPEPTEELWRATCERLLVSSMHQDHLIEALLTLARSEGGVKRKEAFELSTAIDSVLLSPELATGDLGLRIHTNARPALVSGDARLIERLVRNLIDNAIRYNRPHGRVDITAGARGGRVFLAVSNTGPEIAVTEIDRLFRPFERLAANRSGHRDGSGLGLSIVKAIADAHGASVTAVPRPQGGLTVEVRFLPAEEATGLDAQPQRAEPSVIAGVGELPVPVSALVAEPELVA
jgi:signal transduction histidine kinase